MAGVAPTDDIWIAGIFVHLTWECTCITESRLVLLTAWQQYFMRWVVGVRNSNFKRKARSLKKVTDVSQISSLSGVRIQASFILKGEGVKWDISCFRSAFEGDVLISFSLEVIHRWAWSGCFLGAKQRYFSLMLITWEAGFPEKVHHVWFKFIGNIPLVTNL